jgi:hypothetical protein
MPGLSVWKVFLIKWKYDRLSSEYYRFSRVDIIARMLPNLSSIHHKRHMYVYIHSTYM